ncbi:MAG TPA: hypothetical protein VLJ58_01215 [Ramlibacter sp.]|nr:hypothetical protein [Ramlibacter sp.]
MSLMRRIFGGGKPPARPPAGASTQFHESQDSTAQGSRSAPRRELVKVVLRDTLRRHGIPSDWIDSRILSVVSQSKVSGLHLHFIVRQGHERLLNYVPAFQASFMSTLEGFDPKASDWLLSVGWEFDRLAEGQWPAMPDPGTWAAAPVAPVAAAVASLQPVASAPVPPDDTEPAPLLSHEDEVKQDLQALFAIRDAALLQDAQTRPEFAPTRPSEL